VSFDFREILLFLPALLLSLSVHEYAHALVATRLGDPTPVRQGRLTLSPLAHIDPIGTVLMPVLGVLARATGSPVLPLAWAKPVETIPVNYTRKVTMWTGLLLVSLAGPGSNFLLAIVSAVSLRAMRLADLAQGFGGDFALAMMEVNVGLGVFNLIPLPPLDGARMIPREWEALQDFLHRYSGWLLLLVFMVSIPGVGRIGSLLMGPVVAFLMRPLLWIAGLG
jgi:Zn-dependent protease